MSERVSDARLAVIANSKKYSDHIYAEEADSIVKELIDLRAENARLRAREPYVQHMPGCDLGKKISMGWCPACHATPDNVHSVYQMDTHFKCGGPWYVGLVKTICTCGLDKLKGAAPQ